MPECSAFPLSAAWYGIYTTMVYHNHARYYVSVYLLNSYLIHCTGLTTWSSGIKWPIKHNELKAVMMIHSTWIDCRVEKEPYKLCWICKAQQHLQVLLEILPLGK